MTRNAEAIAIIQRRKRTYLRKGRKRWKPGNQEYTRQELVLFANSLIEELKEKGK